MRSTKAVRKSIAEVEGFDVRFVGADPDEDVDARRVDDYPFERAARGSWTVAEWKRKRFDAAYPEYFSEVLDPMGGVVHGKTLLENLRLRYQTDDVSPAAPPIESRRAASVAKSAEETTAEPARVIKPLKGSKTLEQTLWETADKMRGNLEAGEYKHVVLGLVFLKYVSDAFEERRTFLEKATSDEYSEYFINNPLRRAEIIESRDEYTAVNVFWVPAEARWGFLQDRAKQPEIGVLIDKAMDLIEAENPQLKGVLPKQFARGEIDKRLLGELLDLIATIGFTKVDHGADDVLGRVYEYFLGQFASSEGKRAGEYYTPRSVVRLLVEMLEPYHGRVYDPCCGSGGMFVQSAEFVAAHGGTRNDIAVYGQEFTAATWRLAKMNLAIRGIEANLGDRADDSFHRDLHPDLRADFVLANPPFNVSDWYSDALRDDARWKYGQPPANNGNFAWIQHFIHHLAPNGVAGFVLANGSLSSKTSGEGDIRKSLVEANLVDCVVALPEKLFFNAGIPVALWFISKNRAGNGHRNRRGEVLFIDARKLGEMATRTLRVLSTADTARIASTYHNWRNAEPDGAYEDVPGFCKAASIDEIGAKHDFVLTPGRYVGAADVDDDGEPIEEKLARLRNQLLVEFKEADRLEAIIRQRLEGLIRE